MDPSLLSTAFAVYSDGGASAEDGGQNPRLEGLKSVFLSFFGGAEANFWHFLQEKWGMVIKFFPILLTIILFCYKLAF